MSIEPKPFRRSYSPAATLRSTRGESDSAFESCIVPKARARIVKAAMATVTASEEKARVATGGRSEFMETFLVKGCLNRRWPYRTRRRRIWARPTRPAPMPAIT